MSCPSLEDIIIFALFPEDKKNENIAYHIWGCSKCLHKIQMINDFVRGDCKYEPEDVQDLIEYFAHGNQLSPIWKKLENIIEKIYKNSNEFVSQVVAADTRCGVGNLFAIGSIATLTASDDVEQAFIYEGEIIEIGFAADLPPGNPYYWYAKITILPGTTVDSLLIVSVTDYQGESVDSGTLTLLGIDLIVKNGITRIRFSDFRDNVKKTKVAFCFQDNIIVEGNLVIC